jgi:uncharacterized protein (UPF0332 family)
MNLKKIFKKFKKEGKLKIGESSEEISKSYPEKSENPLLAAKVLKNKKLFEESISMSYYAMYNKVLSLFFLVGIKSESHTLSLIILKNIFDFDVEKIKFAKKERIENQYYVKGHNKEKDAKDLIKIAEEFIEKLDDFVDKLSEEKINNFIEKLKGELK